ncbi:ferritin-like domain-containing protein [Helicobacter muridarum]|uniref:Ferritin-like domain-containing protein n=1 Tax=Helicobacter muridarum TaxID=216 RepID=A0A099TZJ8_9HELI|nr:ferritin-like domain-containing protein [Helicobacter muridarum]TLD99402.1 ferritin-like domain-containing protein [Helicobacter muridarum]STQ85479.1 Uncharacterized protein conserved in bacteria [Helicobacter muridarum]
MEFFSNVYDALVCCDVQYKKLKIQEIQANFLSLSFYHSAPIHTLHEPSYAKLCEVIHPTRIKRPKKCDSIQSVAKILHSVAHIEYSAIDLGLDAAYRFRNMPSEYYLDFISLSFEEILHFGMLESLLLDLGFRYGDFAVHDNLFLAMIKTPTLIERMALIHKGLEALGLDSNPFVANKIKNTNIFLKDRILEILDIILHDEIGHVAKGGKWLLYAQQKLGDSRSLSQILEPFSDINLIGNIPNVKARIEAGYTQAEIESLQALRKEYNERLV